MFNMMTLDGFFEGPNRDIRWHNVDAEFNSFAVEQLDEIDTLLFGRVTYELMAGYWPTPTALRNDPVVAGRMNSISKLVFSRTLRKVEWSNSRLVNENAAQEIEKLKRLPGKDMAIFGSSDLTTSLMGTGLIDELRIMLNPVVLGNGKPLFTEGTRVLKLIRSRTFRSGNVLLSYKPKS